MRAWARVSLAVAVLCGTVATASAQTTERSDLVSHDRLRVCADPANLPFTNKAGEGFENAIAELLAAQLGRPVEYTWFPQATGFVRNTLFKGLCDVILGYGQGDDMVLNTNAYYTSAYVIVVPKDGPLAGVDRLSDPRLKQAHLGIVAGTPPASHLVRLGLIGRAKPYPLMVDRRFYNPQKQMIDDLEAGKIDAAIMWGPNGGYYAKQAATPLEVTPLLHEEGAPRLFYRITMGVRQGEDAWKRELNSLLRRNQDKIDAILAEYGVPLLDDSGEKRLGQ